MDAGSEVNLAIVTQIDKDLQITASQDPEVMFRWYTIGLGVMYNPVYVPAYNFVSSQGRGKYVFPIYESMAKSGQQEKANQWNNANMGFYSYMVEAGVYLIINGQHASRTRQLLMSKA
jgi:leukotriene-A4 hydrolase